MSSGLLWGRCCRRMWGVEVTRSVTTGGWWKGSYIGIVTGVAWRDLPRTQFGPWQTVWKRHCRYARDGTWDRGLQLLLSEEDAIGAIDWDVSVDATIARAHQHATNTTRPDQDTRGSVELAVSRSSASLCKRC